MRFSLCLSRVSLLIGLILSANGAFGQAGSSPLISIKRQDSKYWIQANPPAGISHLLQASDNLHLWVDVSDELQAPFSLQLDDRDVAQTTIAQRYHRLVPTPETPQPIRLMIIGDSMGSECCGWGQGLPIYFKANTTIINYSYAWQSTKVFLAAPEFNNMMLIKPDVVLVNFCYMDGSADVDRHAYPPEFTANLRTIVQAIQSFNGIPIMVTLHAARRFDATGNLIPTDHVYNAIIKQVAGEYNLAVADLYKVTYELYKKFGPSCAGWMQSDQLDELHYSPLGAQYAARELTHILPDFLGPYMTGIFEVPPPPPTQP